MPFKVTIPGLKAGVNQIAFIGECELSKPHGMQKCSRNLPFKKQRGRRKKPVPSSICENLFIPGNNLAQTLSCIYL
jgi:hypothetical protein